MIKPVDKQHTLEVDPTPYCELAEFEKISTELEEIVQRLTAATEGDRREAVNLMLAHALTSASNDYDLCIPTTMKVVNMVVERMLGQAEVVGTTH